MTVFSSKKPSSTNNNSRDSTNNVQQQQQQQQQTTSTTGATSLPRPHDEENSFSTAASTSDAHLNSTNPIENDLSSMATTSSHCFSHSKRKSHYHCHPLSLNVNKQVRRRRTSSDVNLPASSNSESSNDDSLCETPNDHLRPTSSSSTSQTTVVHPKSWNRDDQCNSEDEYEENKSKYDRNNLNEVEIRFAQALKEQKGLIIKPVQEDGACLFRAVSDQVFGDEEMHATVRQNCMDYIVKNADFFRAYITEDFDRYVQRKRRQNCHGNHIEMIALSEIYNRPIEVYEYTMEPINVVHGMYKTDNEPIRLSYHCSVHYNSIVDPWRPTAGHGLGLPDLQPGHAQESLIVTALQESEQSHIERTMLDDKLAATDWEATQNELIEQIARESYLQWLCDTNQQSNGNGMIPSSTSSATTSDKNSSGKEATSSKNVLPLKLDERTDCNFALPFQYNDNQTYDPTLLIDDEDDEDALMQQVLAMSRLEYVETLQKQSKNDDPNQGSSSSSS